MKSNTSAIKTPCLCGCGEFPKYRNSKYVHGHHLRVGNLRVSSKKPSIENICALCGITFIAKGYHRRIQKYCSPECQQKSARSGITRNCLECQADIYVPINRMSRKVYCSRACQLKHWNAQTIKNQKSSNYRNVAWLVFDRRCYDCGYNEHPEILVIHHIDGNRYNGNLDNLVPLCQNCHCLRHIQMRGNAKIPSARRHNS